MDKERTLQILEETGVVAVIRVEQPRRAYGYDFSLAEGGIKGLRSP